MGTCRVAVVCARAASKGVPGKNLWKLNGEPLVSIAVRCARESGLFELVAASSDSQLILDLSEGAGAGLLVRRPDSLATDTASKLDAIRHAVLEAEARLSHSADTIVDLDVTTPLRQPSDVAAVVTTLEGSGAGSVFTASPARRSPYFNLVEVDDQGRPRLPCGSSGFVRRQDAPLVFDLSGAVYAWRREALFRAGELLQPDSRLHLLPVDRAWDIDDEHDLRIITALADVPARAPQHTRLDPEG